MRRHVLMLLACALLLAGVLAGCGGGGKSKTGPTVGLTMKQARARNVRSRTQSYQNCEQLLNNSGLPADQKALIQQECADIQSGDNKALHAVDVQLCQLQAQGQPDPGTALAECKKL